MEFSWDPGKRRATLETRDLDFADADLFFDGRLSITAATPGNAEERWKTTARIEKKIYTLIWMWRGANIHVISMRRAHGDEERAFRDIFR
jgi:uncharacterized protein